MREWISDEEKKEHEYYGAGIFGAVYPKRGLKIGELIRRGKLLRSKVQNI